MRSKVRCKKCMHIECVYIYIYIYRYTRYECLYFEIKIHTHWIHTEISSIIDANVKMTSSFSWLVCICPEGWVAQTVVLQKPFRFIKRATLWSLCDLLLLEKIKSSRITGLSPRKSHSSWVCFQYTHYRRATRPRRRVATPEPSPAEAMEGPVRSAFAAIAATACPCRDAAHNALADANAGCPTPLDTREIACVRVLLIWAFTSVYNHIRSCDFRKLFLWNKS